MGQDSRIAEFEREWGAKGYEPLEPFFVLREGEINDERNGGVVKLDKDRLEKIAEIQNHRIASTGDATPIIIGHTRRGLAEKDQPPVVGLASRWEVVKFYKTGTYGLQATPWAKPGKRVEFERHPRRSAELWTDPDLIDPISILGANTPRLDLGLHQLQRDQGRDTYQPRRAITLEMADMHDPADNPAPKDPASSPDNSANDSGSANISSRLDKIEAMLSMLQPLFDELSQQGGDPAMGAGPGAGAGGMPPGPGGPGGPAQMGGDPSMGGMPPQGPPPGPPQGPAQMSAYGGGMNTMMPQQFGYGYSQPQQPMQLGYQPQYSGHPQQSQPVQLSREQREIQEMRTQLAQLQLQKIESEVGGELRELSRQIVVDLNPQGRDFQTLVKLSKADRDIEVAHWKATRKATEQALPGEAVPMQFQLEIPQMGASPAAAGPTQLSMQHAGPFVMPGDPRSSAPTSAHDELLEVIRNKGKLSPEEAFAAWRSKTATDGTKVF